ncbi:hypothetical protein BU25DRAFT_160450 [Macroventuria anomochaeta]|uniref:Uncharacterized protein n=1 Tax=Macroventuria anomochaeta TaxID=301207 RepID=A0ACB6RTC1_9PLEO|nr:uncharacterized protein BU25DRAFT_160450 [Macroventuria anomochaeta]KAF2624374.1 hypothetical protein BU25DRAFT_160450 [Macroventuria anomochaeta]
MADDTFDRRESASQQPHIYRPIPRRNFDSQAPCDTADSPTHAFSHTQQPHSPSDLQNSRSSDFLAQLNARLLRTYNSRTDDAPESPVDGTGSARLPRQNKSFLNMNSSTLFGIYDDVGASTNGAQSVAETPWGTGAETPGHTAMGWNASVYETGTGGADAGLSMKNSARRGSGKGKVAAERRRSSQTRRARSGVARYAVLFFKLAALFTFGVLYGTIVSHLHDTRHKPGLSFSLIVTSIFTSLMFLSNPTALLSPSAPPDANATHAPSIPNHRPDLFAGIISYDNLAVVTWVGSVLFCSCVCFGNIGRRLALLEGGWKR